MDPKLIQEITDRVRQVQKERADESMLAAHLDAIAEVYETDRTTVESIARKVIGEGGASTNAIDLVKVRNTLWIAALVLIMIAVIWLLYSNTKTQKVAESNDLSKENQRITRYVDEALASLNVAKIYVVEHFQTTGAMPSSFAEIGIKESDLVATKYIDRLQMSDDGAITVDLSKLIGDQRYIELKPILRIASHQLEWDCRSNLDAVILDQVEGCTTEVNQK